MLSLELKDAYIYNLYSNIFAYDDTADVEERTIIQRDLVLNGTDKNKEDFKISIHSLGTDNNINGDFGNDFITEMVLSIVDRRDEFKELDLNEFIEKLKEITRYYVCEDDGDNFRKIKVALNMAISEQDNLCADIKSNLSIETTLPDYIVSDNTVLITILHYEVMASKLAKGFIKNHPDVDFIIDSFACGSVGDSRFIVKMAESNDFYCLNQLKNEEIVNFANNVLKENAKYKNAWAVSEMTLKRILYNDEDGGDTNEW